MASFDKLGGYGIGSGYGIGTNYSGGALGMPSGIPSGIPNVSTGGAPVGGSFWQWLAGLGQDALRNPQVWQAAGAMLGAAGESSARNRERRLDREGETFRRMQQADYLANYEDDGRPRYSKPPSEGVRQQADALQDELMKRLSQPSGPSFWERFATIAGPAAAIYGTLGTPGLRR